MDRRKFKVIRGARAYLKIMENDGQIWQQQRYYCYTTTVRVSRQFRINMYTYAYVLGVDITLSLYTQHDWPVI